MEMERWQSAFGSIVFFALAPRVVAGLVVGGLYRYVRNPMYIAVVGIGVGQALLLGRPGLLVYAALIATAMAAFARWHEEPTLQQRFGIEYAAYQRAVPAWKPRRTPWSADR
jgi:protein-S-isoprenylcysteine O-methyltransferase Ste14